MYDISEQNEKEVQEKFSEFPNIASIVFSQYGADMTRMYMESPYYAMLVYTGAEID